MDLKVLFTTFGMIFLAELGDKTQLATFLFAADSKSRVSVFLGSSMALVLTSLLAVVLGGFLSKWVPTAYIKTGAGAIFIMLGLWMLLFPGGK